MSTTNWRVLILEAMDPHGETMDDVVKITFGLGLDLTNVEAMLNAEFDDGFGSSEGAPFTCWTAQRVYFPVVYDGAESVGSVPRHPCDEACEHVGGQ